MSKLSQNEHWDSVHVNEQDRLLRDDRSGLRRRAVRAAKRWLGEGMLKKMSAYDAYLQWEVIFPAHLPKLTGANIVEVGSAPGDFLVAFSQKYGCVPHGIEYSEVGVQVNKEMFSRYGFNPDNVIHTDFFSDEFQGKYRGRFDVVLSRGFIEHFTDVTSVIDRHMNLLTPGGYLILSVPNLRGANNVLSRVLDGGAIPRHNLQIMRKDAFAKLFERVDLEGSFCDYYGTFNLCLYTAGSRFQYSVLKLLHRVQPVLNLAFRTLFGNKGAESGMFSPSLLYIGRKIPPTS